MEALRRGRPRRPEPAASPVAPHRPLQPPGGGPAGRGWPRSPLARRGRRGRESPRILATSIPWPEAGPGRSLGPPQIPRPCPGLPSAALACGPRPHPRPGPTRRYTGRHGHPQGPPRRYTANFLFCLKEGAATATTDIAPPGSQGPLREATRRDAAAFREDRARTHAGARPEPQDTPAADTRAAVPAHTPWPPPAPPTATRDPGPR